MSGNLGSVGLKLIGDTFHKPIMVLSDIMSRMARSVVTWARAFEWF